MIRRSMGQDSGFPRELLPSNMFTIRRSPILWIGSGISKRYVEGFQTWDELLSDVAAKFGVDKDRYMAVRMGVIKDIGDPSPSGDDIAMRMASKLSRILVKGIEDGEIIASDILDGKSLEQYRHGVDPLKLLVCSSMGRIEFKTDMKDELDCFRELRYSVPSIVTTNYDNVLETLFNNEFKVFNEIDEYYGPDEMGIGEIYKIHGTVGSPNSIVLMKEDYDSFQSRYPIVASKIVSLMCESPLLIMGYSMEDRIIREIIGSMFSSFSKQKAMEISKNIVCLQYSKDAKPTRGIMQIESSSGLFQIQTVVLNDFLPVLKDISRYRMSFSVNQIRMLRKMMVDVSLSPDPNNDPRLAYAGIDGIDDVDPVRTVIALSTKTYLDATKSFKSYSIDDVISDVLYGRRLPAEPMVELWFEADKRRDVYYPIFGYLLSLNRNPEYYSKKLSDYIDKKHEQYKEFFRKCDITFASVNNRTSMQAMFEIDKGFKRADLITFSLYRGIIDEEEAIEMLRTEFEKIRKNDKSDTSLKRAVTYLDFRKMPKE